MALDELRKEIEKLRAQYAALTGKPAALFDVNNIEQANAAIQSLEDGIDVAQRKAADLERGFGGVYEQLKAITGELGKEASAADKVTRAYKGSKNIAEKLKFDQQGIYDLTRKDLESNEKRLKTLLAQATAEAQNVKHSDHLVKLGEKEFEERLKIVKAAGELTEAEEAILRAQRAGFPVLNELIKKNKERLELEEKIEDSLGLSGALTKALSKIPGIGDAASKSFNNVSKRVREIEKDTGKIPTRLQTMGMFAKEFGKNLSKAISDPLTIFLALGKAILEVDKGLTKMQKTLAISREEAIELENRLERAAYQTGQNAINSLDTKKAFFEINNLLGGIGKANEDNLQIQARLTKLVGVQKESAAQLQYFSEALGKDFAQQYKSSVSITHEVSRQYGFQLDNKKVLETVGKASAYNLVQFKGSTDALTEAVAKAQALGTSLETVNKVASSLLQFESSISAELEAELLTGKQINLERARYYALTNNLTGLMDELNDQMGDFSDFQEMNVIQQQAFAQALGMSVGELSDMLIKQEYLDENGKQIKKTSDEDLQARIEKLSLQEQFNATMEKLKLLLVDIVNGPLGKFAESITNILDNTTALYGLLGAIAGVQIAKMILGLQRALVLNNLNKAAQAQSAIAAGAENAFKTTSTIPYVGFAIAAGLAATVAGLIIGSMQKAPKAQFGAEVIGGGSVMVGEVGPEIVNLPAGAKVNPLPVRERRDLQPQQTTVQNDNKEMLQALTNMNQRMVEQQRAMSNMRIVLSTNAVEAGLVQNTAKIQ